MEEVVFNDKTFKSIEITPIRNEKERDLFAWGNSLYKIIDGPTWEQSETFANSLGGNLVAINSEKENNWIVKNLAGEDTYYQHEDFDPDYFKDAYWTGLRRDGESFSWSNGDTLDYKNFGNLEPLFNGDYGEISLRAKDVAWASEAGKWNDEVGHHPHYGIAEIPFIRRGRSAYVVVEGPTWEEAEANASDLGGHLVSINNAEENSWIVNNLAGKDTYYQHEDFDPDYFKDAYWIGLRRDGESFFWSNGDDLNYENFGNLEPLFNGDYGEISLRPKEVAWASEAGNWNDEVGHHPHYGIAEIDLFDFELNYQLNSFTSQGLSQTTVLGDSIDKETNYTLEISGKSLRGISD